MLPGREAQEHGEQDEADEEGVEEHGIVLVCTVLAVRGHAFEGASGSVYFGRAVSLNLTLLVLPVAVWITGSLLAARICGSALTRSEPRSTSAVGRPLPSLFRLSVGRRPWSIANGAVVVSLIVAVAVSLAVFTAVVRPNEGDRRPVRHRLGLAHHTRPSVDHDLRVRCPDPTPSG